MSKKEKLDYFLESIESSGQMEEDKQGLVGRALNFITMKGIGLLVKALGMGKEYNAISDAAKSKIDSMGEDDFNSLNKESLEKLMSSIIDPFVKKYDKGIVSANEKESDEAFGRGSIVLVVGSMIVLAEMTKKLNELNMFELLKKDIG
jgi:hypothetical protein